MFETSEGKAPNYSVQTTHPSPAQSITPARPWSTYGGRVGVWRLLNMLDRLAIPATFFTNARCAEEYPDAVRQIVKSGHDLGGHAYTQDQLLAYMSLDEQQATIRKSIDLLEARGGQKVTGWASPVVAFTPETAGYLAKAGLTFTTDVTYADLPIKIRTEHGVIAGVPTTDFSDNRVMRASPRDFLDAHKGTFDYLLENEPMGLHVLVLHCQFGGRPLMTAVIQELLKSMAKSPTSGHPCRAGALGACVRRRRAQLSLTLLRRRGRRAAPAREGAGMNRGAGTPRQRRHGDRREARWIGWTRGREGPQ
jgi:peptidoglycan/xylan/chitin deacetylase (PgdA/CDA1 family)